MPTHNERSADALEGASPIAPDLATHSAPTEIDPRYLTSNPREILAVLRALLDNRALVSAHLVPDGGSFLTAVLEVDDDTLLLDGSPDAVLDARVERTDRLACTTQLDKIRIQFELSGLRREVEGGKVGFRAALPPQLMRLQRREFFRIQVPLADKVICTVPVPSVDDANATSPRSVELRILDISGGGLALAAPSERFELEPDTSFPGCTLRLPDTPPITTRLTVRNVFRIRQRNGTEVLRAGCEFSELSRQATDAIQRYILRIERERNARNRWLL